MVKFDSLKVENTGLIEEDFLKVYEVIKMITDNCVYQEKTLVIPSIDPNKRIYSVQKGEMTKLTECYELEIRFRLERYFSEHIFKHIDIKIVA